MAIKQVPIDAQKIDNLATDGLDGVNNSLTYRVHEIEKHFHSREHWRGMKGVQTATDWSDDVLTPFQAISGNNDYGGDANDEAQVLGTDNTPVISGYPKYDLHRILIIDASSTTVYKLRLVWGTGTMADAITANQFTEIMVQYDPALFGGSGVPTEIMMPRVNCGTDKIWIQAWNATNNATIDFLVGWHEYQG